MKNALKEKFKNNVLVKPLYRKLKNGNKIRPKLLFDNTFELDGQEINVKRNIVNTNSGNREIFIGKENKIFVGSREKKKHLTDKVIRKQLRNGLRKSYNMISAKDNRKANGEVGIENKSNKLVLDDSAVVVQKIRNTWLRLYPEPKLSGETVGSVIFRCILCQLGLFSILVLWTAVWVFVIQYFEGPNEIQASLDFEKEQNFLVIDLATELRQITPLSPKWRSAIERRLQDEKHLTLAAVDSGARVHHGQFWDLSGTFLFTVYVMTALGFGAPVPQTTWGRISALIYAIFAVPAHLYLMLNASKCLVVRVENYVKQLRRNPQSKQSDVLAKTALHNGTESCSRSSEVLKTDRSCIGKKIICLISVLGVCRGVPLLAVLYYACGAVAFGLARGNSSMDIALFPLEFTTSGRLDSITGHVRILYGCYVEGAVVLLSCALATLRRHSRATLNSVGKKYRLFESEK